MEIKNNNGNDVCKEAEVTKLECQSGSCEEHMLEDADYNEDDMLEFLDKFNILKQISIKFCKFKFTGTHFNAA